MLRRLPLAIPIDKSADGHDHGKYDQIPYATHAMGEGAGQNHEGTAAQGQDGQKESADGILVLFLADPLEEDGQVHSVHSDDGNFRIIEWKKRDCQSNSEDGSFTKSR